MDFDAAVAQLDTLVRTLQAEGDQRALLLLELVDAIHRPALERIVNGELEHAHAQALIAMYGFLEPELLVEEALDEVRPYIESHGGDVELLGVEDGVVHVRMHGSCVGCAGSAITLRRGVEEALREHYPGFRELVADDAPGGTPPPMAPGLAELPMADLRRPVFEEVGTADELPEGALRAVEAAGVPVLLARVRGEVYAVRDGCVVDGLPLEGARLTSDGVLVCPWHNCAYDVRSGRRADGEEGDRLAVIPVAVRDGVIAIAVNAA